MDSFWNGFVKKAAILSKFDEQGGLAPRTPEEIAGAQTVDLITLPKNVEGANCGNCRFIKMLDPKAGIGMCQNPNVMQEVTERMACSMWDSPGTLRNWEALDGADVPPPLEDPAAAGMPGDPAAAGGMPTDPSAPPMDPAAAGADPAAAGAPAPAAEAKPKPKKKSEDKKPDGKHTINIQLGGKK